MDIRLEYLIKAEKLISELIPIARKYSKDVLQSEKIDSQELYNSHVDRINEETIEDYQLRDEIRELITNLTK